VPAWAALRMALARYDQVQLQKMLASKAVVVLPPKDKVRAAAQIGHIAEAQTYAYQNATRAPFDAERYQEMVDLMLLTSNNFTAITEFEQFGNLQGPRAILKGKLYHDSIWSITPYLSVWDAQTNNVGNLASHSYLEKIAGATLTYEAKRQKVSLKVANHDSLFNSYMASIEDEYLLMNQLRLTGRLGYNQRSTLTVFMLIAGAQDEAFGSFNYQITPRDSLLGSLELDNYYLQDRTLLGSGIIYTGGYDHKLRFEYPDVDISLTGSIDRFNQLNRAITGRALVIFPPNVTINTEAFVPRNFWQVIGTFGFGNSVRESYTHDWRPYANFGVIYASTSGYGYDLDIGLATSVIGRDRFAIYYQEATSSQGQVQKNFIIGMSYLIYC
jgi:polysaccharide biosynthesis protein PelB